MIGVQAADNAFCGATNTMLAEILHHPRRLWLRRALFQVHLWLGILIALYVIVISLSGAFLVFEDEFRMAAMPETHYDAAHIARVQAVIAQAREDLPTQTLGFVSYPEPENPRWALSMRDARGNFETVFADQATGTPLKHGGKLWIDWMLDMHVYLLAGHTGFVVNCAAGIGLLVLAITGTVLWWPGVKTWRRALGVSLRSGWKRINYDLHSAVGFWTLFIVSWWGFTAVCFLFPEQVKAVVNMVSSIQGMQEPVTPTVAPGTTAVSLESIVARQPAISPGFLSGISMPEKPGDNVILYVDRGTPGDFSHRDIDTFDGHTGKLLTVWHYGEKKTLGDWVIWLVYPLHFGTLWGMPVKILWAALGLGLALLSVTGVLMYWNRYLNKRWRALSA